MCTCPTLALSPALETTLRAEQQITSDHFGAAFPAKRDVIHMGGTSYDLYELVIHVLLFWVSEVGGRLIWMIDDLRFVVYVTFSTT